MMRHRKKLLGIHFVVSKQIDIKFIFGQKNGVFLFFNIVHKTFSKLFCIFMIVVKYNYVIFVMRKQIINSIFITNNKISLWYLLFTNDTNELVPKNLQDKKAIIGYFH